MVQRDKLLELSVLSYHRLSPKQVSIKRFNASGGTLGRSEQADWYLPDPERVVSGTHAEISFRQGNYYITDTSTNGLFVNRSIDALGDKSHQLQSGDMLCLGDYEIQVELIAEQALPNPNSAATHDNNTNIGLAQGQLIADTALEKPVNNNAIKTNIGGGFSIDQFTAPSPVTTGSSRQPNNLAMDDHYLAPAALIPDDWDSGWSNNNSQKSEAIPTHTPVRPEPSSVSLSTKQAVNDNSEQTNLTAFLTGLGLTDLDATTLNAGQWQQLGSALQQSILGLIDIMRSRSNLKNSFRVNQTTFQQRENNPLKFSASMDEAFHNLFNRPNSSFMPAKQAIAEAFKDITQHEAAMLAGVSGISSGLLEQLSPQKFEQLDFNQSFVDKINPAQRQARLWQSYRLTHSSLMNELNNTNGGVNTDFISAYEQYLAKR